MIQPIEFSHSRSLEAEIYQRNGGEWKPQIHFTGGLDDPDEVRFIESLLRKYGDGVVSHFIYSPWPTTYSVELQFGDSDEDRLKMSACLGEYHAAFDGKGRLKKSVARVVSPRTGPFQLVSIRPAMTPEALAIQSREIDQVVTDIVGSSWEIIPYPAHLKLPLAVVVDEAGVLKGSAYNRWGLVGSFVVTKITCNGSFRSLTAKQVSQVLTDLRSSNDGYLNPDSNVMNPFQEPFAIHGIPPSGWVPPASQWFE